MYESLSYFGSIWIYGAILNLFVVFNPVNFPDNSDTCYSRLGGVWLLYYFLIFFIILVLPERFFQWIQYFRHAQSLLNNFCKVFQIRGYIIFVVNDVMLFEVVRWLWDKLYLSYVQW